LAGRVRERQVHLAEQRHGACGRSSGVCST